MKTAKWIAATAITTAVVAFAGVVLTTKTYRTAAALAGVQQGQDPTTHLPQFDYVRLAGHDLVNLALGRALDDTNFPHQVLALTAACDRSEAALVVYDRDTDSILATIAGSTSFDSVVEQNSTTAAGPNRARFVAQFAINDSGSESNRLLGGFLTVAGRVHLDPQTGCLKPVLVALDRDRFDRALGDREVSPREDDNERLVLRAGLAHLIGVVDLVSDGHTNTVLVPYGRLSIRRQLPVAP